MGEHTYGLGYDGVPTLLLLLSNTHDNNINIRNIFYHGQSDNKLCYY